MDRQIFELHESVEQVLNEHPETSRAFLALKTQCVGCYLARFCSLHDVARTYEVSAARLLEELETAVLESFPPTRSNE